MEPTTIAIDRDHIAAHVDVDRDRSRQEAT